MTDFKEKVVLIRGAGKGMGRKLTAAFAARGAIVAANDISPINVEDVVDDIRAQGGNATAYVDDIAKKVGAQALVKQVEDDFGRIDILVNHASVEPRFALLEMDEWDWHRTLDVNLTAAFLMTQSVGRMMREQGEGLILNIITEAGREERPMLAAFYASMAGLETLSQQAERELAPFGVHVAFVKTHDKVESILELCKDKLTK